MKSFLYFIPYPPEKQSICPEDLKSAGLGYAMEESRGFTAIATSAGPSDKSGILIGFVGNDGAEPAIQYRADAQQWKESADGKFWVGLEKNSVLGPTDLARKRQISGKPMKLRDGAD
jgi:hypothetical protein